MSPVRPPALDERTAGVVVTYFPDADFSRRLAAIAREAYPLIVVDNTTAETSRATLRLLCEEQGAQLIENAENLGLGAALNAGFARAEQAGCAWAVAFDQDSTPEPGLTRALRQTAHRGTERAAIVGANWRDEARPDSASRHLQPRSRWPAGFERAIARADLDDVTCVITSGTLFHLPTVRALGGFDASLFLDLVDTDFCLRGRAAGHMIRVSAAARLAHRRGAKRPIRFAGREWWPAFMPATRLYCLARNRVLLLARHGWRFPHWALYELVYAAKVLADILFLENEKAAKLSACWRGTWHGMLGRTGKIS